MNIGIIGSKDYKGILEVHFTGEKSEIQLCTLIMATDQKLLDLARSILQTITKTQENLGEMLKIQKRKNEMNH